MVTCPNKNLPEWKELVSVLGENEAYYIWDQNNGYGLDKAPNGAQSKLFSDLLSYYNGDRTLAIRAKANVYSKAFKNWFGDWNRDFQIKPGDIVFGHPAIGKTFSVEHGKYAGQFIDWDVEYNRKRDKWIEEHSNTKKGTDEYKKARNEYLIYPERHLDYIEFLTSEWNRVKQKAKSENKILIASPNTLLKLFPKDFNYIINLEQSDFIKRNMNRGGDEISSKLWKEGIDKTITQTRGINSIILKEGEYFEDILKRQNNVSKVTDENGEPLLVYHGTRTSKNIEQSGFSSEMSGKGNRGADNGQFYFTNSIENAQYTGVKEHEIKPLIDVITSVYDLFETSELPKLKEIQDVIDQKYKQIRDLKSLIRDLPEDSFFKKIINTFIKFFNKKYKTSEEIKQEYENTISSLDKEIIELLHKTDVLYKYLLGIDFLKGNRTNTSINTLNFINEQINESSPFRQIAANRLINLLYGTTNLEYSPKIFPVFLNIKNPLETDFNMKATDENPLKFGKFSSKSIEYNEREQQLLDELKNDIYDGSISKNKFDILFGNVYIAKNPNQIKSIDNKGAYSTEDNNIYNQIESQDELITDVDPVYVKDSMFAFEEQSGTQTLTAMKSSDLFFESPEMRTIADSFTNIDGINVVLTNDSTYVMQYDANTRTIKVSSDAFYTQDSNYIGRAFLHELVHDYTVNEYQNNSKFAKKINKIFDKVSSIFPEDKYGRKGLYYGLSKPEEFISEIYTNSAFRELVLKNSASVWQKFLSTILDGLGLSKLANIITDYKVNSLINSITRVIDKRNTDPSLTDLGDGVFNMDSSDLEQLKKESMKISQKILNGMKARNRSLRSRGYSPVKLEQMEQELNQMQMLYDKQEDKQLIIDFIQQASVAFKPSLIFIREAAIDPSKITNERLLQFKEDFLEFYGPIVYSISEKLEHQGYFDDISPESLNKMKQSIEVIDMAYKEMKGKYDKLIRIKTVEFIRDYFVQNNLDTESVEAYINDVLNSTNTDLTYFATVIRSTKTVGDLGMRTMYKIMSEINDDVQKFANEKAQKTLRVFEKLSKSQINRFYEVDEKGKATGYLIRDLNYGRFKRDLHKFLSELDAKYGVDDKNISALDDDTLREYQKEKEEWLASHCERKFKPEYYKAYLELKPKTKERLESLNGEIGNIIVGVTDEQGIHLERLTSAQWKSLDALYNLRRNLANVYHSNGELKTGEELEIAEDLKKFYDVTGNGNIRSITFSNDEVIDIMRKKKEELSPEDYAKWERRSISRRFSEEFIELMKTMAKKDYGKDTKLYQELVDKRNELRSLGRDNNNPYTDTRKLHESVKEKILELDEQILKLSKAHRGGTKPEDLPFTFEKTPQYEADKARMKSLGKEQYRQWYDANHLSNGQPASYYTRLIPKDLSYIELRLNMANRELDKDSPLVNREYDFDSPEYYQPKRSIYDNSEAYKKALATDQQKEVYKLILDTMSEANNKITFMKNRDSYKLPQITGDLIDFAFRKNSFFKGIKDYFGDGMVANADDVEYSLDNYTQKPDGTKLNFIDTHYIQMLEKPEYISRNLAAILVEYSRMAENYRLKQNKQADFELFAAQLANRDFEDVSILTRSKSEKKGIMSNKYKMYSNFLEMNLYGQFRTPLQFTIGNKTYSLTKIFDKIRYYASTSNLSHNYTALGKSLFQGIHKSVVEAIGGRYYSADDYFFALGRNLFKLPKMLWNLGNVKHNDLTLAIMEYNGISRDSREKTSNYQYIRPFRVLLNHLFWGGWSFVDYIVKAPVVEAIYKDHKLDPTTNQFMSKRKFIRTYYQDNWKEGSKAFKKLDSPTLLDAYYVKDGIPTIKDEYKDKVNTATINGIAAVVTHLTNRIDGMLSQEDKTKLMSHALGGALFMHRSFYIVNLDETIFTDHQYNPYVDDYVEAKYKSGFRAMIKWVLNARKFIGYRGNEKVINSVETYNMKKIVSQLFLTLVYSVLVSAWLRPSADDDEDNWLKQYINYIIDAVVFDERSEYNPLDVINKIKSPSAIFGPVDIATGTLDLINPFMFDKIYSDETVQKGAYEDMYLWEKRIYKAIPGVRGVIESRDIRTKQQYLDSQIKR